MSVHYNGVVFSVILKSIFKYELFPTKKKKHMFSLLTSVKNPSKVPKKQTLRKASITQPDPPWHAFCFKHVVTFLFPSLPKDPPSP